MSCCLWRGWQPLQKQENCNQNLVKNRGWFRKWNLHAQFSASPQNGLKNTNFYLHSQIFTCTEPKLHAFVHVKPSKSSPAKTHFTHWWRICRPIQMDPFCIWELQCTKTMKQFKNWQIILKHRLYRTYVLGRLHEGSLIDFKFKTRCS